MLHQVKKAARKDNPIGASQFVNLVSNCFGENSVEGASMDDVLDHRLEKDRLLGILELLVFLTVALHLVNSALLLLPHSITIK